MISKLIDAILAKNAPVVVGLDPKLSMVPAGILDAAFSTHGETLEGAADALFHFNCGIVDAVCDLVPAVKPQIAMYEEFGVPGLVAYRKTIDYCHEKGLIVIGDIKRGDIGSTSASYAASHLGTVTVGSRTYAPFDEDFSTVNPYLGTDGVKPFADACREFDKGIFVLVKTSNPSSGEFQDRSVTLADGTSRSLYEVVADKVNEWGADLFDAADGAANGGGYSNVGAVVGATYPEMGAALRAQMPHAYILVPGYGAQGGRGKDLVSFFNNDGLGAIVNSSRGIIAAYQSDLYREKFDEAHYADASRQAVLDMISDINRALGK